MIARDPEIAEAELRDFSWPPASEIRPFIGEIGENEKYLVTAIGPKLAVTAQHIGIRDSGQRVWFPSVSTTVVETIQSQTGDLTYFRLRDPLNKWSPIYRGESLIKPNAAGESVSPVLWAGNGIGRGTLITNDHGELIGWWPGGERALRCAMNYIDRYDLSPVTQPTLQARFQVGSRRDAHACDGDSGGPVFVEVDRRMVFAGVVVSDGGQPATFGKIGMVASLITRDIALIDRWNEVPEKPIEPPKSEQPIPANGAQYISDLARQLAEQIEVRVTIEGKVAGGDWFVIARDALNKRETQ